jgi:hypothetical protein
MSGIRRTIIFAFLLASLLIGCSPDKTVTVPEPLSVNGGVELGMSRQDVIQAMLDEVQLLQMSGQVTNPYATRFVKDSDGESLEVMYYYMGMKKSDDKVSEDELVPIILKEDAVVGWGWEALEEMAGSRPGP